MPQEFDTLKQWIGRTETQTDHVTVPAIERLTATLDRSDPPACVGDADDEIDSLIAGGAAKAWEAKTA